MRTEGCLVERREETIPRLLKTLYLPSRNLVSDLSPAKNPKRDRERHSEPNEQQAHLSCQLSQVHSLKMFPRIASMAAVSGSALTKG